MIFSLMVLQKYILFIHARSGLNGAIDFDNNFPWDHLPGKKKVFYRPSLHNVKKKKSWTKMFLKMDCSFDARKHPLSEGRHWYDPQILGARAHFQLGVGSSGNGGGSNISRLSVADIRSGDHGVYRCRVDFKLSPTRNARVNLTVISKSFIYSLLFLLLKKRKSLKEWSFVAKDLCRNIFKM